MQRLPNGLWYFCFGKNPDGSGITPVEMLIQGNVKMKCIRRSCQHWNVLTFLPPKWKDKDLE